MPQYTVHYFNARGRAELTRLLFHQAGVPFKDHRFDFEEWKVLKTDSHCFPFGQAPILEVDGKILPQSYSIARFVANEYGLNGSTNWEKAVCDSIVDTLQELKSKSMPFVPVYFTEQDETKREEKKKEYFDNVLPIYFNHIQGILKSNNDGKGFIVGDSVTWADFAFMDMVDNLHIMKDTCLNNFPLLKGLFGRIKELPAIHAYREARPDTLL